MKQAKCFECKRPMSEGEVTSAAGMGKWVDGFYVFDSPSTWLCGDCNMGSDKAVGR